MDLKQIEQIIPNEEKINLREAIKLKVDYDSFNVLDVSEKAFSLKRGAVEYIKVPSSSLTFDGGNDLVYRSFIPSSTVERGSHFLLADFYRIRQELIEALARHTNDNSVVIHWERPAGGGKFRSIDGFGFYEIRAYIERSKDVTESEDILQRA